LRRGQLVRGEVQRFQLQRLSVQGKKTQDTISADRSMVQDCVLPASRWSEGLATRPACSWRGRALSAPAPEGPGERIRVRCFNRIFRDFNWVFRVLGFAIRLAKRPACSWRGPALSAPAPECPGDKIRVRGFNRGFRVFNRIFKVFGRPCK